MTFNLKNHSPMRNSMLRVFLLSLLVLLPFAPVSGQTTQGSLEITVTDSSGAVVPGATIIIKGQGINQTLTQTTSSEGVAVFNSLPPGTYNIRVERVGFAAAERNGVRVETGQSMKLEILLEIGLTSITVLDDKGVEEQDKLSALPNLNNDLTPLLQVLPGAVPTNSSALGRIVVDGKGKDQTTIKLDGMDATQLVDIPSGDPALDIGSSFQKPEAAFDLDNSPPNSRAFFPMFGPGTGTVVEGTSFRGNTNYSKIEGWKVQLNAEHRNSAFNARNFFDFDGENALRRTRFGGKVGGPLQKDRTFLFFAYDGLRGRTERNVYEAVPVDALCNCTTGPSASLMRSYLPAGTSIVPGASLNPDFLVARRRTRFSVESNAFDARLDFVPSIKRNFTFRFTRQTADVNVPDGVTARLQRQRLAFNNVLAKLQLVGANTTQDIKFGINQTGARVGVRTAPELAANLSQSLVSIGATVTTTALPGAPVSVPVATAGGLIKDVGRGFDLNPISFNVGYDLTHTLSTNNEMRFGVETRFIRLGYDRLGGLNYTFPDLAAVRAATPSTVTFLSDLSAPSPFNSGGGQRHARQEYYLGYFQMVSKFRPQSAPPNSVPRLILTYGLRYDYFGPVREQNNRAVVVDPQTGLLLPPGTRFYHASKNNFQPRFALEYRLAESGPFSNTVLRAGAGVYSGVPKISDMLLPIDSDRFSTGLVGGTYPIDPSEVVRSFVEAPETRQYQPLAFARDFTTPERAYKWESSLTKTLNGYDFKVLYTGNVGRNLPLAGVANQIVAVATNPDPTRPAIVVRQFDIVRSGQVLKPFGEFFFRSADGRSSYNGLTFQVKRNHKSESFLPLGLNEAVGDLNAQYTFSRNVGNVSGAVASNPLDFGADFGYNAADARHSLTVSAVYDLWKAVDKDPIKGRTHPLWGWTLTPSINARSGFPLFVKLDRPDVVYVDGSGSVFATPAIGRHAVINTPGGGATGGARVPDLLPGVNPYLRDGLQLLNPLAFAIPAPGSFGNLKRGQLRGPSLFQVDLGLTHFLFQKEKMTGMLRVDIFNIFNRANFSNPPVSLPNMLGTDAASNQIQPGLPFTRTAVPAFGIINAADIGRQVSISLTLRFNDGFTQ